MQNDPMQRDLPQKNLLVIGGTGDLGLALVRAMLDETDSVTVQGIGDLTAARALAAECPKVRVLEADLTDADATAQLIEQVRAVAVPTHLVHLPALQVVNTRFRSFDEARFEKDFTIQAESAVRICKAFVPEMAKAGFGRVLFVLTSYLLGLPPKNVAAYVMAKSAVQGLARSLAVEYAAKGVTVNSVAPGMIETNFLSGTNELIVQASAAANPMGRNAQVGDVVPAMRFLISEEARYITGVTLPVTGGAQI